MKNLFTLSSFIFALFCAVTANAQRDKFVPFKPSPKFLVQNPSFLKDSAYVLNGADLAKAANDNLNFKLGFTLSTGISGAPDISSDRYPLKSSHAKRASIPGLQYVLNADSFFDNMLEFDAFQMEHALPTKDQKKQYAAYDELYTQIIAPIAKKNNMQFIKGYLPLQYIKQNIYFNIAFANIVIPKQTGDLPAVAYYNMAVLDGMCDTLAEYKQAVFGGAYGKDGWKNADVLKSDYLAEALPNLLGQFLNDDKVQEKIAKSQAATYDETYIKNKLLVQEYWQQQLKKWHIQMDLTLNCDMQALAMQMEASNKETVNLTNLRESLASATGQNKSTTSDAIGAQAASLLNMIAAASAEKRVEEKKARAEANIEQYNLAEKRQKDILIKLSSDPGVKLETLQKVLTKNQLVAAISASLDENTSRATGAIKSNSDFVNNWVSSKMAAINTSANSGVETSAISNGNSGPTSDAACKKQADDAWKSSAEYINYKKTPTNANASDCKAKIIELTIQYCGGSLPANELSQLKQVAANERNMARQLRSATPGFKP